MTTDAMCSLGIEDESLDPLVSCLTCVVGPCDSEAVCLTCSKSNTQPELEAYAKEPPGYSGRPCNSIYFLKYMNIEQTNKLCCTRK